MNNISFYVTFLLICGLRNCRAEQRPNSSDTMSLKTSPKLQSASVGGDCDYCQINSFNTYCRHGGGGVGASCGKVLSNKVDAATRQEILDAHNDLRGKVSFMSMNDDWFSFHGVP